MGSSWHIFIVAHWGVVNEFLDIDPDVDARHYSVLNVKSDAIEVEDRLPVLNQIELPRFRSLGGHWAESEAIYNVYRSGLHRDLDYIGFLQYDKEFRLLPGVVPEEEAQTDITRRVEAYLAQGGARHISFETHPMIYDYRRKILADDSQPNTLHGRGLNCYRRILRDYNEFFGTRKTRLDLFRRRSINLCSSFLMDTESFDQMMAFFSWVVDSHKLDHLDPQRRNRLQGGLAERYFGVFLMFHYQDFLDLSIHHHDLH